MNFTNALLEPFLQQYQRWILWCPVLIATGVGAYFGVPVEPPVLLTILIAVTVLAALILEWRHTALRIILMIAFCLVIGFTAANVRPYIAGTPMLEKETGPALISGKVISVETEAHATRIILSDVSIEDISADRTPRQVRLKLAKKFGVPRPLSEITVLGVLLTPSSPVSPRSYDFRRHMFFQGIGGTGYAVAYFKTDTPAPRQTTSETLRENIKSKVLSITDKDQPKAVLIALLTGERRLISDETWEMIRQSGIAHLLAISGLHIGLVAGFIFFIIRAFLAAIPFCALHWPIKKISAVFAFTGIFIYCWLVGAPVSAQRAVVMTGIVLFAVLIDRVAISLRLAAFAAMAILIVSPESLLTPGFQMSFSAVVCLIAFYEHFQRQGRFYLYTRNPLEKVAFYFIAVLVTTVVASLATAPFALFHFQRVAMLPGVLANMLAVPLMAMVVMPLALVAVLLMPLGWHEPFVRIAIYALDYILNVAAYTSDMPGAVWNVPAWPVSALIVIVLGALWTVIWQQWLRLPGVFIMICGICMAVFATRPDILISGEGDLIAIHDRAGHLALSDNRKERFVKKMWQSEYGRHKYAFWPEVGQSENYNLRCDQWACIYTTPAGQTFSFIKNVMAVYKDCANADMVIAAQDYSVPEICKNTEQITRGTLRRQGAHAIYLTPNGYQIETTHDRVGDRPWTPKTFGD